MCIRDRGYTAIYTGLDSEESSQVVSAINELGITDVKMGTDGSISVPSDQADNVRMQLSIQGYPKSTFNFDVWNSGIGIWSTDTEKKVLQIQQLQTHLMKAINTISAVKNSYVIITMPENSNYVISTDSEEPRVSVKPVSYTHLNYLQIKAIIPAEKAGMNISDHFYYNVC